LEEGSVGAEEGGGEQAAGVGVQQANVVGLALQFGVGIVSYKKEKKILVVVVV